LAVKALQLH